METDGHLSLPSCYSKHAGAVLVERLNESTPTPAQKKPSQVGQEKKTTTPHPHLMALQSSPQILEPSCQGAQRPFHSLSADLLGSPPAASNAKQQRAQPCRVVSHCLGPGHTLPAPAFLGMGERQGPQRQPEGLHIGCPERVPVFQKELWSQAQRECSSP